MFFNPPAIIIRKRVPIASLSDFNIAEEFALHKLQFEPDHLKPYQLGVVLALWVLAGEFVGDIELSPRDSRKIKLVNDSCIKVLKDGVSTALSVLMDLADQGHSFGLPSDFYRHLMIKMFGG